MRSLTRAKPFALTVLVFFQACSSTVPVEPTGSNAINALDRGDCPSSIIDARGRNAAGNDRYAGSIDRAEITRYQAREISNCRLSVARGDSEALEVLVGHFEATGEEAALLSALELYAEHGTDPEELSRTGTYLYRIYAVGSPATPRNPTKAFNYLGVAVNNGARALEITYARALTERGLYNDAERHYLNVINKPLGRSSLDRCEAHLGLAYLYFGVATALENWNTGYYQWRSGGETALGSEWGSCVKDNFTSPHYEYESRRKKFVDARIAMMSPAQRQVIDEARSDPNKGYEFVAALSFKRPATAPAAAPPVTTGYDYAPGWPAWRPVQAPVCGLHSSPYAQPWSDVFEVNARTVWTVDSRNGYNTAQGTAVAVSPRELVTNCHLIANPMQITLRRVGASLPATLKAADRDGDRCLLEVGSNLPAHVSQARGHAGVRVGEDVAAIGNPQGLETSLSRGIVAQKRSREGLKLIQTDAAISAGSSGGGLFDQAGNLVGITTFTVAEGQSLNFAIAIDEFCR